MAADLKERGAHSRRTDGPAAGIDPMAAALPAGTTQHRAHHRQDEHIGGR